MLEKMPSDFRPIAAVMPTMHNGSIRLCFENKSIDIEPEFSQRVWQVLTLCNGLNSLEAIIEEAGDSEAAGIISDLVELGALIDARKQYLGFHKVSNYPTPYAYNHSQRRS